MSAMSRDDFAYEDAGDHQHLLRNLHIANNWIAAKGFVDFAMEVVQICGSCAIGKPWSYLNIGNLFDLVRSISAFTLFFHPENKAVHIIVIFFLWERLLEIFTSAEKVARQILPIRDLWKGLPPALLVFFIGFGLFTHAFYAVKDTRSDILAHVMYNSFSALITAGLPEDPFNMSLEEGIISYLAILMFSIFFLNIFIGVIGELYQVEKDRVELTFQDVRATSCLTFLLRARVLPCALVPTKAARAIGVLTFCCSVAFQMYCITLEKFFEYTGLIFIVAQLIMIFSAFQFPNESWGTNGCWQTDGERHYLWICKPRRLPEPHPEEEMRAAVREEVQRTLEQLLPGVDLFEDKEKRTYGHGKGPTPSSDSNHRGADSSPARCTRNNRRSPQVHGHAGWH